MITKYAGIEDNLDLFCREVLFKKDSAVSPDYSSRLNNIKDGITEAKRILENGDNPFFDDSVVLKLLGGIEESSVKATIPDQYRNYLQIQSDFLDIFDEPEENLNIIINIYERFGLHGVETITTEYTEEVQKVEEKDNLEKFYVSEGLKFSKDIGFFGPFDSREKAVLFSILIHYPGDNLDNTMLVGEDIIFVLGRNHAVEVSLDSAKNIKSAVPKNNDIVGGIEQASLEYNGVDMTISTSGTIFDLFSDFINKNIIRFDNGLSATNISNLINSTFIKRFVESVNISNQTESTTSSIPEINKVDTVISNSDTAVPPKKDVQEKETKKKDSRPPLAKLTEALNVSEVRTISIVDLENDVLSDRQVSAFVNEMIEKSKLLADTNENYIELSFDSCLQLFSNFFKDILDKDKEIKEGIRDFRRKNQLNFISGWSQDSSADWEFENRFSITKRIFTNDIVGLNIKKFFASLTRSWFNGRSKLDVKLKIKSNINSYKKRANLELDDGAFNDAFADISGDVYRDLGSIAERELDTAITKLVSSSDFNQIKSELFIKNLLEEISPESYIFRRTQEYFQSPKNIIKSEEFKSVKCGMCSQITQVPAKYADLFDEKNDNIDVTSARGLFRSDGSFISDAEIKSRRYRLSTSVSEYINKIIEKTYINSTNNQINTKREEILNKEYSIEDANSMIYGSDLSNLDDRVFLNIVGNIIKNDILAQNGATYSTSNTTKRTSIFSSRTLCASSLLSLSEEMRKDERIFNKLNSVENYSCKAKVANDYSANKDSSEYTQAYTQFTYSAPKEREIKDNTARVVGFKESSGYVAGYRFSRMVAGCPCHIDRNSEIGKKIIGSRKYSGLAEYFAIPNIPDSVAIKLMEKEQFSGLNKNDIYHPPTTEGGSLASNYSLGEESQYGISDLGYLICGNKVSISNFDKAPDSQNYIEKVLSDILRTSGRDKFIASINLLINYGVDSSDLKPYIDSILKENIIKESRDYILSRLLKASKVSYAQDLSGQDVELIKTIGLVCQNGHRFTIEQSMNFSKTHFAIDLSGGRTGRAVPSSTVLGLLSDDSGDVFKMLISNYKKGNSKSGLGLIKALYSEESLREFGFLMPHEMTSIQQLKEYIKNKKLYYKSDDGVVFTYGDPDTGYLTDSPWDYSKLERNIRRYFKINKYIGGVQSTTAAAENGQGNIEMDFASNSLFEETSSGTSEEKLTNEQEASLLSAELKKDYGIAEILMPNISVSLFNSNLNVSESIVGMKKSEFTRLSAIFIEKITKVLRLSRTWGSLAVDSQIDFLSNDKRVPENKPSIFQNIPKLLALFASSIGKYEESEHKKIEENFYKLYDIKGLIERQTYQYKFLSMATVAQYYSGFTAPNLRGLAQRDIIEAITNSIAVGVGNNLSRIFDITDESVFANNPKKDAFCKAIANELYRPYIAYDIKDILENMSIDYTGRAIILSYAIDYVNNIRSFYSKYFFNQGSSLYLGPIKRSDMEVMSLIDDMLESKEYADNDISFFTPKILVMSNSEFEEKLSKLKLSLEALYSTSTTFYNYIEAKNVKISEKSSNLSRNSIESIVFSRYIKCFEMAIDSIDHITADVVTKPSSANDIIDAAKILDKHAEDFMQQRDPEAFDEDFDMIKKSRMMYGESDSVFERNAVRYGRINLNSNEISFDLKEGSGLAPMIAIGSSNQRFRISMSALENTQGILFSEEPYVILVKEVVSVAGSSRNITMYICIAPNDIKISKDNGLSFNNADLINYISKNIIRLNTKNGKEFASRYVSGIDRMSSDILDRLILVPSEYRAGRFYTPVLDSGALLATSQNETFNIRIQNIDSTYQILTWPPQQNLIVNNQNVLFSEDTVSTDIRLYNRFILPGDRSELVKAYFQNIYGNTTEEFIKNIDVFPTSRMLNTVVPSSSYGIVLPISLDKDDKKMLGTYGLYGYNTTSKNQSLSNTINISKSRLAISNSDGTPLDISWCFLMKDPDITTESGDPRIKIIQSTVVQKMHFIKRRISELYTELSSDNFKNVMNLIADINYLSISYLSLEEMVSSILSELSVKYVDIDNNISLNRINLSYINSAYEQANNNITPQKQVVISKISELIDLCNASKILNKKYTELQPALDVVDAKNFALKENNVAKAFAIRLLDPYSLWNIIHNPMMRKEFGGPIDGDNIQSYRDFVIQTYGLENFRKKISEKIKISDEEMTIDDLFDIPGFYMRLYNKDMVRYITSLRILKEMLHLVTDENEKIKVHGAINYPVINVKTSAAEFKSGVVQAMLGSSEMNSFEVHPDSYLTYPVGLSHSLSDIPDSELAKIQKEAKKESEKYREEVTEQNKDKINELNNLMANELSMAGDSKTLKTKIRARYERKIRLLIDNALLDKQNEYINNHPRIVAARRRAAALSSGEEAITSDEFNKAAKSTYNDLLKSLSKEAFHIVTSLYQKKSMALYKDISQRKIAQSISDDSGTIIRSLYNKWWEAYLSIMSNK